jgi:hypothetical protein
VLNGWLLILSILAFLLLMIRIPLIIGSWLWLVGLALVFAGAAACVHAIFVFASTPAGEPFTGRLYRCSRSPQLLGTFIALAGACLAAGSWAAIATLANSRALPAHPHPG